MRANPLLWIALALSVVAAKAPPRVDDALPAFMLGEFVDDYGSRYVISSTEWKQGTRAKYHIVRINAAAQYAIAQNDSGNPGDPRKFTRIDWLPLSGMAPFTWAYCYSAFAAESAAAAEGVTIANREAPRTGCNNFPFSRMKPAPLP